MRKFNFTIQSSIAILFLAAACVENDLDQIPKDENFPIQMILDADEGGDLPDAEDYGLEITFADHVGELPGNPLRLAYSIDDLEDDMVGAVTIDKIIYEYETDNCVYERELTFTKNGDGLGGTIDVTVDQDLGSVPPSFEVVFTLPGHDDTEGSFSFTISNLVTADNLILGAPLTFEYEVLDTDVAGDWKLEISNEENFEKFKSIFGPLNGELEGLKFPDITGDVTAEFEYGEMKFVLELKEEEEVVTCENGETQTEIVHLEIEIEADYDAEDGELALEGSHLLLGDDGDIMDELDFIIHAAYEIVDDQLVLTFNRVIDEDHYKDGEELFRSEEGITFTLEKD